MISSLTTATHTSLIMISLAFYLFEQYIRKFQLITYIDWGYESTASDKDNCHNSHTAFPLSHYANGFSHSPNGNTSIEAKPQPEITPNGSFAIFLRIMRSMEMGPSVKSNETFCARGRDQHLWRLVT